MDESMSEPSIESPLIDPGPLYLLEAIHQVLNQSHTDLTEDC